MPTTYKSTVLLAVDRVESHPVIVMYWISSVNLPHQDGVVPNPTEV